MLLFFTGYFVPRIIHDLNALTLNDIITLSLSTIVLYGAVIYRIICNPNQTSDKFELRKLLIPYFCKKLTELTGNKLKYKIIYIEDFLSNQNALALSRKVVSRLKLLIDEVKKYNLIALEFNEILQKQLVKIIETSSDKPEDKGGFPINIYNLV